MSMPRFRIIKELPVDLCYRDGRTVTLRTVEGMYGGERLMAQRSEPPPGRSVYLAKATPPESIAALLDRGFEVEAGSPAERILRSLVERGYAVEDSCQTPLRDSSP